jgi:hypothetical protein
VARQKSRRNIPRLQVVASCYLDLRSLQGNSRAGLHYGNKYLGKKTISADVDLLLPSPGMFEDNFQFLIFG